MVRSVRIVLMAGGQGTRLWPKSRRHVPKQFMDISLGKTLFQHTIDRIWGKFPLCQIYVTTLPKYQNLLRQQAPDIPPENIIIEPTTRSTTACLAYTVLCLEEMGMQKDDVVVLLPTDAFIDDDSAFCKTLLDAIECAVKTNGITTIGIRPSYPATKYGYIHTIPKPYEPNLEVERFVEKPNLEQAKLYTQDPTYYWNSGIFVWKASVVWALFKSILPDVYKQMRQMDIITKNTRGILEWYSQLPDKSFEYSIIEKASTIHMVPARFQWMDLGNWTELITHLRGLQQENSDLSLSLNCENCMVYNDDRRLVGLFGTKNLIVINTNDVVFVFDRDREHELKFFIQMLEQTGLDEFL